MKTIADIRRRGYTVDVIHERVAKGKTRYDLLGTKWQLKELGEIVDPRGGKTIVRVHLKNGNILWATQNCSNIDNYCKKTGIGLCLEKIGEKDLTNI